MNALGIILADNSETNLPSLIKTRTLAALPFNGRYRLIDYPLSNLANAGINRVGIITNHRYESLMSHVKSGAEWNLERKNGGLTILPPFAYRGNGSMDYRHRLEAMQANLTFFRNSRAKYVFICGCNCFGNFDLSKMLKYHKEQDAFVTIAYTRNARNKQPGVPTTEYVVDSSGRVQSYNTTTKEAPENACLGASIYLMKRDVLLDMLEHSLDTSANSLKDDIILPLLPTKKIMGYELKESVFFMDNEVSYLKGNLDVLDKSIRDELYHQESHPVITTVRDSAPAWYGPDSKVTNSMIAAGTIIEGEVRNSVIHRGVHIKKGAVVENSVVMKNSTIGENAHLNYAILDKQVIINDKRVLSGYITHPFVVEYGAII